MGLFNLRALAVAAVLIVIGAAYVENDDRAELRERNAALRDDLQTAQQTIDHLARYGDELEHRLRLATEARDWMQYQIGRSPDDGSSLWQQALELERSGRTREARAALLDITRRHPGTQLADDAEDRLREIEGRHEARTIAASVRTTSVREPESPIAVGSSASYFSYDELRAAMGDGMPVGEPRRVFSRLSRSGDALEDPARHSDRIPVQAFLSPAERRELDQLRGRTGCFIVRMNLDGSVGILGSEAGRCGR
jgi:hypothetical protein